MTQSQNWTVVKSSELGDNWSAEHHVEKARRALPHDPNGGLKMATFKLEIACDNAAFVEGGSPEYELSRILRDLSRKLEHARADEGVLRDINGNKVGTWRLEKND